MSTGIYGGDEVGAIVLDIGSHSIRGGFAGEDLPKADIPSYIGVVEGGGEDGGCKYYIDTTHIKPPRPKMVMKKLTERGLISDWDLFNQTVEYFYKNYAITTPDQHPLLMSEPVWNTPSNREKLSEVVFETFNVPAFYLAKDAVLSSFATGRSTSLILDCGYHHTTATPVYDGLAVLKASTTTTLSSHLLSRECHKFFELEHIDIVPRYQVVSKELVKENCAPVWKKRKFKNKEKNKIKNEKKENDNKMDIDDGENKDNKDDDDDDDDDDGIDESYRKMCVEEAVEDFIHSVVQVSDGAIEEELEALKATDSSHYEFNSGFNRHFGLERFKLAECLFDTNYIRSGPCKLEDGMGTLVKACINKCDVDIRASLYSSIVVVGGGSLLSGFVDRLNNQLCNIVPPTVKYKVTTSSILLERKFSSWIGASILASLGSFQQLWITRQEYDEMGVSCVGAKCH